MELAEKEQKQEFCNDCRYCGIEFSDSWCHGWAIVQNIFCNKRKNRYEYLKEYGEDANIRANDELWLKIDKIPKPEGCQLFVFYNRKL